MKTFTLFKRDATGRVMSKNEPGFRDRHWHFKFTFRARTYPRCLETNDAELAQTRARAKYKAITEAIIAEAYERLDATKIRHTVHEPLRELLAKYLQSPVDAVKKTRESNVNALLNILKKIGAGDDDETIKKMPYPQLLTAVTAAKFFGLFAGDHDTDPAELVTNRRSANSLWSQAASIAAPRAIAYYKTLKIHHECLDAFVNAGLIHRFTRLPRIEYNPPADEMIQKTLTAWEALDDRNLFLAIGHELAFGLRIGEVAQARSSWWTTRQGYPVLDGEANVKNKTGIVQVRALDPFYTTLRIKALAREWLDLTKDDLIITGSDSFRTDGICRAVSDFLRRLGWQTQKTNHALRAYAGSQVAMKFGIYDAQTWLRHSSVKVTEGHYSHFVRKFKPQNLDDIAARWATLDQAPILTVVELSV